MTLHDPVEKMRGIGPSKAALLARLGVFSVGDLLFLLPRDYRDLTRMKELREAAHGETVCLRGRFGPGPARPVRLRSGIQLVQARLQTQAGSVLCLWYNQPWIGRQLKDEEVLAIGTVDLRQGAPRLVNPSLEPVSLVELPVLPVYPLTRGLTQKLLRKWVRAALETADITETLPGEVLRDLRLMPLKEALSAVHFPQSLREAGEARRRLDAEELLLYGALLRQKKHLLGEAANPYPIRSGEVLGRFLS